ncbi:MAG: IS1380 family transposase [Desulfocapsaceae bacterium]|nr:IS1380 family transposase [Desulfocapsaceae bacterium]
MSVQNNKRSARVSSRKVTISNHAKGLTSQAGLVPVVKFLRNSGLIDLAKNTIELKRGSNALYDSADAVFLTVVAIMGGARALSSVTTIWADGVLRRLSGWVEIPDNSTLGRLFRTFRERQVSQLEILNHRLRGKLWGKALRKGTSTIATRTCRVVDVDSTVKTAYGKQQGVKKGYNPFQKGKSSFHPILAFCAETKEILQGWLRSGDAYTSNGIVEFTKQLLAHLPESQTILFRGDSGFFNGNLFDLLDQFGHSYLVKVKLKGLKELIYSQLWEAIPGRQGWEQCMFWHQCANWTQARRFVAVRQEREKEKKSGNGELFELKEYDFFCYVTTEELTCWQTHKSYGKRATCETWIEEAKNQMALAHIKMDDFRGSSALFQCAILAYNTIRWMALCSGDKQLCRWEPSTIRSFLIRVAGKIRTGSNQFGLNTPANHLYPKQWAAWVSVGLN